MKRSLGIAIAATLALSACTQKVWTKAGATQQDYYTDSYGCEKDARQSSYFGGGLVGEINMQQFNDRCMVAHGWRASNRAQSTQPDPRVNQLKLAAAQRKSCLKTVREEPNYSPLLPHLSDLNTGRFDMAQLADERLPTLIESKLLVGYVDESLSCFDKFYSTVSQTAPAIGPIFSQEKVDVEAMMLLLIKRQLTWGEAAQRQQSIQSATEAKLREVRL